MVKKLRLIAALAAAVSLTQASALPSYSLTLGKRQNMISSFIAPPNEKLPEDDVVEESSNVTDSQNADGKKMDLSPLSLNEKNNPVVDKEGFLKSSVTENEFLAKEQDAHTKNASLSAMSVTKGGKSDKLGRLGILKKAKTVNVMPLPLLESPEETAEKIDQAQTAERSQLADLWESALSRSPDIQFVIQKLMPTSDPGHATGVIMKMLTSTVFGAMSAANMMAPNAGVYMGQSVGASMIMNLLSAQESKNQKNARLSQTEAIMLYNMVRNTADRLVGDFRGYKKNMITLQRSLVDLQDLQAMIGEARAGQDASKQVEMEYTLRKAQRDVDVIANDVKHFRQALIDLSGADAVNKLDKQLDEERVQLASPAGDSQKVM